MSDEGSPWTSRVLVGALVLLGIVAGLFTFLRERDPGTGQFHPDNSFVAITSDAKLEIRDGVTGKLLRLLREDLTVGKDALGPSVHISVTPDGRYAFHDAATTACKGVELRAIARVDLVRGVSEVSAAGESPVVSPDGKKLAYLSGSVDGRQRFARTVGGRPECGDPGGPAQGLREGEFLVVRDLVTGDEQTWRSPLPPFGRPVWLADSKHLRVSAGDHLASGNWVVDLSSKDLGDPERPGRYSGLEPRSFLSAQRAFGFDCYVKKSEKRVPVPPKLKGAYAGSCEFALIDADDGEQQRHLATLRAFGDNVRIADLNATRDRLLAGWLVRDRSILLGYKVGAKRTVNLGTGVLAAEWLPELTNIS